MIKTLRVIGVITVLGFSAAACAGGADQKASTKAAIGAGDAVGKPAAASLATARLKDRVVIRSAELRITAKDLKVAAEATAAIANQYKGYVDAEQSNFGDASEVTIKLKIPADNFDDALQTVGKLGKVESQHITTDDVTGKSIDLEARLGSQRAAIDRLRVLVGNATNVTEVLAVERELDTRLADLDSLQAQLDALDSQTQFATISAQFSATPPTPKSKDDKLPGFVTGLRNGWSSFVAVVTIVGAAIGFLMPYLVPAIVLGVSIVSLRRRRARSV